MNETASLEASEEEFNEPEGKSPQEWQEFWQLEWDSASQRHEKYNEQGRKIVQRFLDDRTGTAGGESTGSGDSLMFRLNLFHTNVITMMSMLYGNVPKIDVKREWSDADDDVARVASVLMQRMLQGNIDMDEEDLPTVLRASLEDRLMPGHGVARVRYDMTEMDNQVAYEDAPIDYVHWNDTLWSYARTWKEVWWFGFRAYLTKDEATERFGEEIAQDLSYKRRNPSGTKNDQPPMDKDLQDSEQKAEIWEIWSKRHEQVFWFSDGMDVILDVKDDPLGLQHFYPTPRPMTANTTTALYLPRGDFVLAQDLYNEIDNLQTRIGLITDAIKVVGTYDASCGDSVGRMLKEGTENDLIPVDNWAMFGEKGGLAGVIDWFPLDDVTRALQTLTKIRDETIELLYQVTGLSDILRGQTDQYTGVKQDEMKAKFASIRVQAIQEDFARFASALQTLKAEVISKHFTPGSIYKYSNAKYLPEPDKQLVVKAIQLIKDPSQAPWRIKIQPESIAMIDYQQLQAERGTFLNAVSTFMQSAQAMIKAVPQAAPMLLQMLKWGLAGFRNANEIEGVLDQAIDEAQKAVQNMPKPGEEDGAAAGQKALEQLKHQNAMQLEQAKHQMKMQAQQADFQQDMQKLMQDFKQDMEILIAGHQSNMAEQQAATQGDLMKESAQADLDMAVDDIKSMNKVIVDENAAELRTRSRDPQADS